jgi:Ca2+-transporting ATPase
MQLSQSFRHIADVCALNNRALIQYKDKAFKIIGEPTEGALKVFAEKLGKYTKHGSSDHKTNPMGYAESLAKKVKTVATLEFSSERKCMSTLIKGYEGSSGNTLLLKGAPERVVAKCSTYLDCHNTQKPLSE